MPCCAVGVALHHGDSLIRIVNVLQLLALGVGLVIERAVGVVVVRSCAVFRVGHLEQAPRCSFVSERAGLSEGPTRHADR